MRCANPKCRCGLFDMAGGSIWLLQLELSGDQPTGNSEEAFSVSTLPQKCFWLCAACSRRFVLWRWTPSGVFLAQRQPGVRYRNAREMEGASIVYAGDGYYLLNRRYPGVGIAVSISI